MFNWSDNWGKKKWSRKCFETFSSLGGGQLGLHRKFAESLDFALNTYKVSI